MAKTKEQNRANWLKHREAALAASRTKTMLAKALGVPRRLMTRPVVRQCIQCANAVELATHRCSKCGGHAFELMMPPQHRVGNDLIQEQEDYDWTDV